MNDRLDQAVESIEGTVQKMRVQIVSLIARCDTAEQRARKLLEENTGLRRLAANAILANGKNLCDELNPDYQPCSCGFRDVVCAECGVSR